MKCFNKYIKLILKYANLEMSQFGNESIWKWGNLDNAYL